MAIVVTNATASNSCSRARSVLTSLGCSKPIAEDFLHTTSNQIDSYHYKPTNYDWKYSNTYSEDFLKAIFFTLKALGTGAPPKALDDVDLPTEGDACLGEAVGAVIATSDQPWVALAPAWPP
jgi:hypothetical protein